MMPLSRPSYLLRVNPETKKEARRFSIALAGLAGLTAAFGVACGKKEDPVALAPSATALASSQASASSVWHYAIDSTSRTHVDLPGLQERIQGDTSAAQGAVDVDGDDLSKSRGTVRVDLMTFTTSTFGNDDDKTQTKHARTWLEVQVGNRTNEAMRWADFAIRSIDGLSETTLAKVAAERNGGEDLRKVAMTVHGDLLVHGHAAPKVGAVTVVFHYPAGAPAASRPARIEIDSASPFHVVLKEHDVRPRDPAGQILEWTAKLVAKVADTADVTVHLTATPAGDGPP
ncbi:MAG TPA: YceI family protein [Polyangiaceae bacterium]|jgi:hypothetical protein|nr:YceI family protein [Polyangiaceae bacterium]